MTQTIKAKFVSNTHSAHKESNVVVVIACASFLLVVAHKPSSLATACSVEDRIASGSDSVRVHASASSLAIYFLS